MNAKGDGNSGRAVVTGGMGFIASHLVDRLLTDGWYVTVVDNLTAGHRSNLQHQLKNSRLVVRESDIRDEKSMRKIVQGHDTVFHFAAHAEIRASLKDNRVDLENNLLATVKLLDAMKANGVQELVFASTSAVYGEAEVRPTPEDYAPVQTSLYGASKQACEAFAQAYTQLMPLKFWAFRFANVVGERCRRGVIWDLIHKLKKNPVSLEILGDGNQSKEYLYVKDCVDGIMLGYEKSSNIVNSFNLGLEEQTLVNRVADIVIDEMKLSNVIRTYTGGRRGWIGDNPVVELSIEKMKRLGWAPKVSSEEAIRMTTRWAIQNFTKSS